MHLFDTSLLYLMFEACTDGAGQDQHKFTRLKTTLTNQGVSIDWLETALGTVWQSLGSRLRRFTTANEAVEGGCPW